MNHANEQGLIHSVAFFLGWVLLLVGLFLFMLPLALIGGFMAWTGWRYFGEQEEGRKAAEKEWELGEAQAELREAQEETALLRKELDSTQSVSLSTGPAAASTDEMPASPDNSVRPSAVGDRTPIQEVQETPAEESGFTSPSTGAALRQVRARETLISSDSKCEVATRSGRRCTRTATVTLDGRLPCELHTDLVLAGKRLNWHQRDRRKGSSKCEQVLASGARCNRWGRHAVDETLICPMHLKKN